MQIVFGYHTSLCELRRQLVADPEDFMFQLTMEEAKTWWSEVMGTRLKSQSVTLKRRGQHIKYRPYAFTEHGILMLSRLTLHDLIVSYVQQLLSISNIGLGQ
jgi:hypothetical protein